MPQATNLTCLLAYLLDVHSKEYRGERGTSKRPILNDAFPFKTAQMNANPNSSTPIRVIAAEETQERRNKHNRFIIAL